MKFEGNFVMTKNNEVNVGDEICYYESLPLMVCDCLVLDLWKNQEEYGFKLQVVKPISKHGGTPGEVFEVSAVHGHYAYGGMWRIYDKGEYTSKNVQ